MKLNKIRLDLLTIFFTLLTCFSGIAYAQIETINAAAGKVTDVADKNPLLAIIYICSAITIVCMYFAWRQLEIIKESVQAQTKTSVELQRLTDALNNRPCIYDNDKLEKREKLI